MTEQGVRIILAQLHPLATYDLTESAIDRAIQTAKQIGSSWPHENINLINLYLHSNDFRIVIE